MVAATEQPYIPNPFPVHVLYVLLLSLYHSFPSITNSMNHFFLISVFPLSGFRYFSQIYNKNSIYYPSIYSTCPRIFGWFVHSTLNHLPLTLHYIYKIIVWLRFSHCSIRLENSWKNKENNFPKITITLITTSLAWKKRNVKETNEQEMDDWCCVAVCTALPA